MKASFGIALLIALCVVGASGWLRSGPRPNRNYYNSLYNRHGIRRTNPERFQPGRPFPPFFPPSFRPRPPHPRPPVPRPPKPTFRPAPPTTTTTTTTTTPPPPPTTTTTTAPQPTTTTTTTTPEPTTTTTTLAPTTTTTTTAPPPTTTTSTTTTTTLPPTTTTTSTTTTPPPTTTTTTLPPPTTTTTTTPIPTTTTSTTTTTTLPPTTTTTSTTTTPPPTTTTSTTTTTPPTTTTSTTTTTTTTPPTTTTTTTTTPEPTTTTTTTTTTTRPTTTTSTTTTTTPFPVRREDYCRPLEIPNTPINLNRRGRRRQSSRGFRVRERGQRVSFGVRTQLSRFDQFLVVFNEDRNLTRNGYVTSRTKIDLIDERIIYKATVNRIRICFVGDYSDCNRDYQFYVSLVEAFQAIRTVDVPVDPVLHYYVDREYSRAETQRYYQRFSNVEHFCDGFTDKLMRIQRGIDPNQARRSTSINILDHSGRSTITIDDRYLRRR